MHTLVWLRLRNGLQQKVSGRILVLGGPSGAESGVMQQFTLGGSEKEGHKA